VSVLLTSAPVLAQQPARLEAPEIDYPAVLPVLIVLGAACIGVLFEAFLPKYQRWLAQVVLSLMTYVVMPQLTRLLRRWLYPSQQHTPV
jgi:antibiotic biosynthesis monooxygenase (ABM) superfamily enzyme